MSRHPAITALWAFFLIFLVSISWAASVDQNRTPAERRQARLISHLKKLSRPSDWRIVRKFFSSNRARQIEGFENCPYSEIEWPWYLSSGHLERYAIRADFIPVNMDSDPEDETLIVVHSDPGEVFYTTFCLVDDEKRGRTPLSSFNEISHKKKITFQMVDLTGDGEEELIIFARDDRAGRLVDSVRIIKPNKNRQFSLVWFGRLSGEFSWPPEKDKAKKQTVIRNEKLKAKMKLKFDGNGSPATIVLSGSREMKSRIKPRKGIARQSVRTVSFEEHWRWDKKLFRFLRVPYYR
ncbi:MAG: hypothetical protein HOC91_12095 [Nitrospinaceae bacterium]|jgi:hypothetical protein|nr:hypothetical protein [Nitrospinaceae bacterium]MBT3435622.1 hypothetical protein [Nitrospinaceae bacterium]MBT3819864.1 hypothetical protein [Nitrospinaceae bacterium]MBT4092776.1 hypothetical protein [Nitrospinaceae bacterium]MBT4431249.1 hypothetical protein [Nitrospinaceae bacterium]